MENLKRKPLHPSPKGKSPKEKSPKEIRRRKNETKSSPTMDDLNDSSGAMFENSFTDKSSPSPNKEIYHDSDTISANSESPMSNQNISVSSEEASTPDHCNRSVTVEKKEGNNILRYLIIVILALFVVSCIFSIPSKDELKSFDATIIVETLQANFIHQPKLSLRSIKKSLNKVSNSAAEPKTPAVILFVSSKDAVETADWFTDCLATLVELQGGIVANVDARKFHDQDPENVKMEIDDEIERSVSSDHLNIFLIKHIDEIPGEAALIMQKFCNHEESPYKRAIFIMTISSQEEIPKDAQIKAVDNIARSRLNKTWVDLKPDQFDPLFTRISDYVSAILPELHLPKCIQ